jgi:hypothetical protein
MLYQIIGADPTKVYSDDLPATYDNTALAKFKKPAIDVLQAFLFIGLSPGICVRYILRAKFRIHAVSFL